MAAPITVLVDDVRFPSGRATIPQILDATYGTSTGQFIERATTGWATIPLPHFAVVPLIGVAALTGGAIGSLEPLKYNPGPGPLSPGP